MFDKNSIKRLMGKNLRRLRKSRRLTQDDLGGALSPPVDGSHIAVMEAGRGISDETLARLCIALKARPWEFYVEDDSPLITTADDRTVVDTVRAAKPLGVSEDFIKYGKFLVEDAKRIKRERPKK